MTAVPAEPVVRAHGLPEWLIDAGALLDEPDPGPTRWLVEGLVVDQALVAAVGKWKTTKSYALLDVCISIATGRPAFGVYAIPTPGAVVFVNEESGRTALRRRIDHLCRGRAIAADEIRGRLHVAANTSMKLDDPDWQAQLIELGRTIQPRLFVFDPLARMKNAARDENAQTDMAPVIEYLRHLRDETGAAVCFVHHTGHQGERMRGSSDLESAWETRLTWKRDGQSLAVEIESEHREAEAAPTVRYRLQWDGDTRTMRLQADQPETPPTLADRILEWLAEHGPATTEDVRQGVGVRKADVLRTLETLEQARNAHRGRSDARDRLGRPTRGTVWKLPEQQAPCLFPAVGNNQEPPAEPERACSAVPTTLSGNGTEHAPDGPHTLTHDEVEHLLDEHTHLTESPE